jgi:hypothetical protein
MGTLLVLIIAISLSYGWFMTFVVGQYYAGAGVFMTGIFGVIWPILIIYGTFRAIKWIFTNR